MVDTTGIRSSASSRSRIGGLTVSTSPTKPRSGSRAVARIRPASSPRQADGERAVDVDGRHDVAVDLADQHHAGDVEGLGVGDPQAVAELGLLAEPGHQLADLRAAAVHDDRPHADRVHAARCPRRTARPAPGRPWRCRRTSRRRSCPGSAGCTGSASTRTAALLVRRARRRRRRSRRAHVLVDVGVGEVVGEDRGRDRRPRPRSAVELEVAPGHVRRRRRPRRGRRSTPSAADDGAAVGDRTAGPGRRRCRARRARCATRPQYGSLPYQEHFTSWLRGHRAGRRCGPRRRTWRPVTWTRTTLVAPSASPTICVARSRHRPRSPPPSRASASTGPATPAGQQEDGVVGRRAAVDDDGVEAVGDAGRQHRLERRRARRRRRW